MTIEPNNRKNKEPQELFDFTPENVPTENFLVIEHLKKIPNIYARGLVFIILLLIITGFTYSVLSKIDIIIGSRAVARPVSHKIRIFCDRDGYIEKIFIKEGQQVDANSPLFLIRSKETLAYRTKADELRRAIPIRREFYDNKISAALDELMRLEKNHTKSIKLTNLKLEQNKLTRQNIESDMEYWKKELELFTDECERVKTLYERGVVSIRTLNISQVRLEKARTEYEKISPLRQINLKKHLIIKEEYEKETEDYHSKKNIIEKEINNLRLERDITLLKMKQELEMNEKMISIQDHSIAVSGIESDEIVRVENTGIVSELYFKNIGEFVQQSQLLCTILPTNEPLYMDITVENKDIGFVENNMKIKYKFDAFPYIDHGVLYGEVESISPSAALNENNNMVYHVKGTLNELNFNIGERLYPIKAGMTANAEIITEKMSIFSIIFRKFKRIDSIPK